MAQCQVCKTSGNNMKRCKSCNQVGVRIALVAERDTIQNPQRQTSAPIVENTIKSRPLDRFKEDSCPTLQEKCSQCQAGKRIGPAQIVDGRAVK